MNQSERFLSSGNLWESLAAMVRRNRGKNVLAVPYIGSGASKLLKLGTGDILLSALTKANCRSGAVCPAELRAFRDRGVRLYQQADLHAKVYLLGKTLIVGSANLSKPSRDMLDEAGILSTDRACVSETKAWFRARLTQPVTPKWLEECERVYRPPQNFSVREKRRDGQVVPAMRVWLMRLSEMEPPKEEEDIRRAGEVVAKQGKTRGTSVTWIRFSGEPRFLHRLSDGDSIVQLWEENGKKGLSVYPTAKLLHWRTGRVPKGRVVYLFVEEVEDCPTLSWSKFKKHCAEGGLALKAPGAVREVRGPKARRVVLSVASPERLGKQ